MPNRSNSSASSSVPMLYDVSLESRGVAAMWKCESCTLLNQLLAPLCELCCTEKPRDIATKYKFWSCEFCILENIETLLKWSACDRWRYSHGPPVSTRAPNVST
ncbi:hypothetical protein DITRI_Ditri09bG0064900 [Diplodiscus trichospermus]